MKNFVIWLMERKAKKLLKKFKPSVVAVVGSVGKTSTKLAIATVLSEKYKVLAHFGSYNTPVALPLAMFNMKLPGKLHSPFAWMGVLHRMNKVLKGPYPYQVLVLELGTDRPGDLAYFKKYLNPDIAVITAVSPEHMENFLTEEAVAKEELEVANYSKLVMVNRDDVASTYAKYVNNTNIDTFGTSGIAEYRYVIEEYSPGDGFKGQFVTPEASIPVSLNLVGEHNVRSAVAAGAVGLKMSMTVREVVAGMQKIEPVPGRMRLLKGLMESTIIDDTYNSSPKAAVAALQTLYKFPSENRIAILGSMNELGGYSQQAHEEVGKACDPSLLNWVITVGKDAELHLAPAAANRGCQVRSFMSPYDAGAFAHSVLHPRSVVLAKGSQNGIFTEEALKLLLHDPKGQEDLVRQTPDWLEIKESQFGKFQRHDYINQSKKIR